MNSETDRRHHIRRMQIHATAPDETTALRMRAELNRALPEISITLNNVLSQLSNKPADDEWIHIPRISLNITLSSEDLSHSEALLNQIHNQLKSQLTTGTDTLTIAKNTHLTMGTGTSTNASVTGAATGTGTLENPKIKNIFNMLGNNNLHKQILSGSVIPKQKLISNTLLHYLKTGNLPWYRANKTNSADITNDEWYPLLQSEKKVTELIRQANSFEFYVRLWALAIKPDTPENIIQYLIRSTESSAPVSLQAVIQLVKKQEILPLTQGLQLLAALSDNLPAGTHKFMPIPVSEKQLGQIYSQLQADTATQKHIREKLLKHRLLTEDEPRKLKEAETNQIDKSINASPHTLRVSFAGLILLYPYLPRLFKQLGWLSEENTIKPKAVTTSAKALIYLASGIQSAPEYQLGWVKVLLGISPDDLLITDNTPLKKEITDELDTVINSLLSHWTALKSSSVQGVQEAFLSREGLLRKQDDYWQLTIEPQGMDVLIQHLPFPLETVKLLWIDQLIRISW